MSNYLVSGRQLLINTLVTAGLVALCTIFAMTYLNYLDLPEVMVNRDGKCAKVINYKNGDGYSCQDVDVTLRKYKRIHIE